jgi:hypothetical protein
VSSPARGGISAARDGARWSLRAYVARRGGLTRYPGVARSHGLRRGPHYCATTVAQILPRTLTLALMGTCPGQAVPPRREVALQSN